MWPQQIYTTNMCCLWFVGQWTNSVPVENVLNDSNIKHIDCEVERFWHTIVNLCLVDVGLGMVRVGLLFTGMFGLPSTELILIHLRYSPLSQQTSFGSPLGQWVVILLYSQTAKWCLRCAK